MALCGLHSVSMHMDIFIIITLTNKKNNDGMRNQLQKRKSAIVGCGCLSLVIQ